MCILSTVTFGISKKYIKFDALDFGICDLKWFGFFFCYTKHLEHLYWTSVDKIVNCRGVYVDNKFYEK